MVQRAVARRLEAIDAPDLSDGSYGFRQGRSPHDALHARRERGMHAGMGWMVDAEVRGYCDSLDKTR
jgi:RNA-directed DNA polymerase